ncbi:hypothetical protein H4R34_000326 [Dimargaris verticillata]|uniref:Uncharacterized protein n=1 Tax=Dimargaris verticillata TaxID=2761393 RepID=A0A9W8BCW1_9FUNG|nr:hypothetical protein H4R34_000326 [Dimargaris verticillata]
MLPLAGITCHLVPTSSIVSKHDTRPFSPTLPPYSAYRYGPHSHEFKHDRGVQLATLYHEMAMAPDTFAWIRDEERYNPDITALRATIRHRLDGDQGPYSAPSPSSGAEPDDDDDDNQSDSGAMDCLKLDSHPNQGTLLMPRCSVSPTHSTNLCQESSALLGGKAALSGHSSDAQRPPLARRKTTSIQPDHLSTAATVPPTRRTHSSTTLSQTQWTQGAVATSGLSDNTSSDRKMAAEVNVSISHTDCETLATKAVITGGATNLAAKRAANQQSDPRCTCCQDPISVDKALVLCTGCLALCDRRLLYAADAEQLLADLNSLDPRAALRAKPKRPKLDSDYDCSPNAFDLLRPLLPPSNQERWLRALRKSPRQ